MERIRILDHFTQRESPLLNTERGDLIILGHIKNGLVPEYPYQAKQFCVPLGQDNLSMYEMLNAIGL